MWRWCLLTSGTLANVLPHSNAMPQIQDMTCNPMIQSRPVVLSIDMEHNTGIHNYPFECLGSDQIVKILPRPYTHTNKHSTLSWFYGVVSQKLGRKCTVPTRFWKYWLEICKVCVWEGVTHLEVKTALNKKWQMFDYTDSFRKWSLRSAAVT